MRSFGKPIPYALLIVCAIATVASADDWSQEIMPFLKTYCSDCHSGDSAEASIDFDKFPTEDLLTGQRPLWNQVRGMIKLGAMPPAGYDPKPSVELRERVADWIDRRINSVDCEIVDDPGHVTMRRLNCVEYDNSVRDLLAIEFSPSAAVGFPSDDVGNGFDNQGEVLALSQLQLEKYIESAALIASRALTPPESLAKQSADIPPLYLGDTQHVEFWLGDGDYEIKPRLQFTVNGAEKVEVVLSVDGNPIETMEVDSRRKSHRMNVPMAAGRHRISVHFKSDPGSDKKDKDRRVEFESLAIEGAPVKLESYKRLIRVVPSDSISALDAAKENLMPIIRRAYRREPTPEDIERIVNVVRMALESEMTFEQSIGMGLQAVLISPHFLFRVETQDDSRQLDSYAMASRLSYFLWSSIPDDTLLDLARHGRLSEPAVIVEQAQRMLRDKRSEAFIQNFFGQYLGLGNLRDVTPDRKQFPQWNDRLRNALRRETELFCREIVEKDLPVTKLLDGDFTYINPRLAELYSIDYEGMDPEELFLKGPGFYRKGGGERHKEYLHEDRWIRVPAPPNRRGVLTHASVLTLTSNPTATSPVKRGKWILETILGDPPPPAPPNVPSLEATKNEHKDLTLRQQLAIHRENPSCASCHNVMDPLGLGFENFDALGRWRELDSGSPIDSTGTLADGSSFKGAIELLGLLAEKQSQIARFFAEKLLTYALGRGLEPYDVCAIDKIVESAKSSDFSITSFVTAIVQSEPFTQRKEPTDE